MAKLAFCGLGQMGLPMAMRLLDAGHQVTVWNRTPRKAEPAVDRGATLARSPAEAAAGAEAAVTMIATPEALQQVLFGLHGLSEGLAAGSALLEMSTVGPEAVTATRTWLSADVEMLDAPVLGSIREAAEGRLKIFAGGPEETFRRWTSVLEAMGAPQRFGPLGSGASMKLTVNSCLVALMATVGEALVLADGLGLDQAAVMDVLADSAIGVTARSKRSRIESGEYPPNFKLALARKDSALVVEEAGRLGLDLPLAAAARAWLEAAEAAGLGDLDYSAVIAHARNLPASLGPR